MTTIKVEGKIISLGYLYSQGVSTKQSYLQNYHYIMFLKSVILAAMIVGSIVCRGQSTSYQGFSISEETSFYGYAVVLSEQSATLYITDVLQLCPDMEDHDTYDQDDLLTTFVNGRFDGAIDRCEDYIWTAHAWPIGSSTVHYFEDPRESADFHYRNARVDRDEAISDFRSDSVLEKNGYSNRKIVRISSQEFAFYLSCQQ